MIELQHIPDAIRQKLIGLKAMRINEGESGASVFKFLQPTAAALFLKCQAGPERSDLNDEIARLSYLNGLPVPSSRLVAFGETSETVAMLTEAVPGSDLTASCGLPPDKVVKIAADALRHLHSLDPSHCPFDHSAARRIEAARERVTLGLVDPDDFDEDHLGESVEGLLEVLISTRPDHEDSVITHGDACLDNLFAAECAFSGFIDCTRLGRADRHQDLALAARHINEEYGNDWAEAFLMAYDGPIDRRKLAFYRLLDEFF